MGSGAERAPMQRTVIRAATTTVQIAAALLLATAVSDRLGLANASFYLLVAGVPLCAAAGLVALARVVDAVEAGAEETAGRLQVLLAALLVATLVIGAAARAPSVADGHVPPAANAALALGFAVLAVQAVAALVPSR
jgi:hypothetical protein